MFFEISDGGGEDMLIPSKIVGSSCGQPQAHLGYLVYRG